MAQRLPDVRRTAEVTGVIVRARLGAALRYIDPRLWLAAAIGWRIFALVTLAALVAAQLAGGHAERSVRADTERLLGQFSTQIEQLLTLSVQTRRTLVQTAAAHVETDTDIALTRRHLAVMQTQYPEFSWLGVADAQGRVVAATGDLRLGEDVSRRPWFEHGRERPYLGEVHGAQWPDDAPPAQAGDGRPERIVYTAAPLRRPDGSPGGALAGRLSWPWIEGRLAEMLLSLGTARQLEVLLVAIDGTVLAGPPLLLEQKLDADRTEGGRYLVGRVTMQPPMEGADPGWTVVVRQDAGPALVPARRTRHSVFFVVMVAGFLAAGAAVVTTRRLTRRLVTLAAGAEAVRCGTRPLLSVPGGTDEIGRIGVLLAHVVNHLQTEKRALLTLNAELDARVAERSARIERMAAEARQAAVTRERLRMARDLHDTLAHSLMALLTQIRLVRKLGRRLDPDTLDAELSRAEEVAGTGLVGARAAITQMRHNDIAVTSLDAALRELLQRFGERTGIAATLHARPLAVSVGATHAEGVFRIVEEALRNVERHAQARSVRVALRAVRAATRQAPARLRIDVVDDGAGFEPQQAPPTGHYGLRGMHEQAELIGATLAIHSGPAQGTRLVIEFDVGPRHAEAESTATA